MEAGKPDRELASHLILRLIRTHLVATARQEVRPPCVVEDGGALQAVVGRGLRDEHRRLGVLHLMMHASFGSSNAAGKECAQ